jgi:hypothetical protein
LSSIHGSYRDRNQRTPLVERVSQHWLCKPSKQFDKLNPLPLDAAEEARWILAHLVSSADTLFACFVDQLVDQIGTNFAFTSRREVQSLLFQSRND